MQNGLEMVYRLLTFQGIMSSITMEPNVTVGLQVENTMKADDGAMYYFSPVGHPNITSNLVSIIVGG